MEPPHVIPRFCCALCERICTNNGTAFRIDLVDGTKRICVGCHAALTLESPSAKNTNPSHHPAPKQ